MMDRFFRDDITSLLANRQTPCISLFMPTTRGVSHEDNKRWKNLLREAEERLGVQGWNLSETQDLLRPARNLQNDSSFWLEVNQGLAGFVSPQGAHFYRLPLVFTEKVFVGPRFHIKPVLPLLNGDGRFYILAFSQKHVRLLRGTRQTVEEVALTGMPTSMEEALHNDDSAMPQNKLQRGARHTMPGGPAGGRNAIAHGAGVGIETSKDGLLEYAQAVNRGLQRFLHDEKAPLVLAAADFMAPIYRQANSYRELLDEAIIEPPDRLSAQDLHGRAWAVVQPHFQEPQQRIAALYQQLEGEGRDLVTSALGRTLDAASQGYLQYLFIATDREKWGTFDPATRKVQAHDQTRPGDEELLNLAAHFALSHKTTVFAVESAAVPGGGPLAAMYWLPIGERSSKPAVAAVV